MKSYPKIYHLGDRNISALFDDVVNVEEKLDGSQLSIEMSLEGELIVKSKACILDLSGGNKQFASAIENAQAISSSLTPGYIYRFEYISKPRHNALTYERVPERHLVGFDIELPDGTFKTYEEKSEIFKGLGVDVTPLLYKGKVESIDLIQELVENTTSFLGTAMIEGVVIKNYSRVLDDRQILLGKFVSDDFKEVATRKKTLKGTYDVIDGISEQLRTEARWNKAIQYLRDEGKLTDSMKDIPSLIQHVCKDTHTECSEMVKEAVFKWAWKQISQQIIKGLPEYYKNYLAEGAFTNGEELK